MFALPSPTELSVSDAAFVDGWLAEAKMLIPTSQTAQALNDMKEIQSNKGRVGLLNDRELDEFIKIFPLGHRIIFRQAYKLLKAKEVTSSSSSSSAFPSREFEMQWSAFCSHHTEVLPSLQAAMDDRTKYEFLAERDDAKRSAMMVEVTKKRKRQEEEEEFKKETRRQCGKGKPRESCMQMLRGLPRVTHAQFTSYDGTAQQKLVFVDELQHLGLGKDLYLLPYYAPLALTLLTDPAPVQAVVGNPGTGKSCMIPFLLDLLARGRAGLRAKQIHTFDLLVLYFQGWYYTVDLKDKGDEKINYAADAPEFVFFVPGLDETFDPKARVRAYKTFNINLKDAILLYDCGKVDVPTFMDICPRTIIFTSSNQERLEGITIKPIVQYFMPVCPLVEAVHCAAMSEVPLEECETRFEMIGGNFRAIFQFTTEQLRAFIQQKINKIASRILDLQPDQTDITDDHDVRTLLHYRVDPATFQVVGIDYASFYVAMKVEDKRAKYESETRADFACE